MSRPVIIIGAGIVGLSTAWALRQRSIESILIDRDVLGDGASYGNAVMECRPALQGTISFATLAVSNETQPGWRTQNRKHLGGWRCLHLELGLRAHTHTD